MDLEEATDLLAWAKRVQEAPEANSCEKLLASALGETSRALIDLYEGRTAVLPRTRAHALNLLTVAEVLVHGNSHVQAIK